MRTNIRVHRRGYSLTVVLLFLVLLLGLWAAVYRTTASFLRVETARVKRDDLDAGMLSALGQCLMYLERNPSLPRTPVSYGVKVPQGDPSGQSFVATFSPVTTSSNGWTVQVAPGTYPTPLPGP
ncbi:MAG: hypothetical protein ACLP7Q_21850 [Isosphaeraceae bacterium]